MKKMRIISLSLCALLVALLVAGCGGGGGGASTSDFSGTYRGRYAFQDPVEAAGPFLLNVSRSGVAEAVFDEGTSSEIRLRGRVNSSGRINIVDEDDSGEQTVTTTIGGQIDRSLGSASGQIRLNGSRSSLIFNGTFSTTRTSSDTQNEQPVKAPQAKEEKSLLDLLRSIRSVEAA